MTILFHPNPGTVLVCEISGLVEPEMVKTRPVIIVSPRNRLRSNLCTIVPLSTSKPETIMPWHVYLKLDVPLATNWPNTEVWAKCDMLYTFRLERLDRLYTRIGNARKYYDRKISDEQLSCVKHCINLFLEHS